LNPWGPNHGQKRRDKLYIIAEILEIARDGALKTQIMYKANLSFTQLNKYLELLTKIKLLRVTLENQKRVYTTTEKGMKYLHNYREITKLLMPENPKSGNTKIPPYLLRKNGF
jgi:predicted transcriptional regulator